MLRIGPAGWSYRDWVGTVYPRTSRLDQLAYMADFFDTIEINSTFYRPAAPRSGESWARRTGHNPRFRFSVKLGRQFTHTDEAPDADEARSWKEGIEPLRQAGKVGAVLVQFPWSFRNGENARRRLVELVELFREFPLVAEFRHNSWQSREVSSWLGRMGVGLCNIDQPVIGRSIRPAAEVTSPVGYLRLHGRNYRNWFKQNAGRDARYDYLYGPEEMEEQVELIESIDEQAEDTYVVYNNHYRGQAVVNALQLRQRVQTESVKVPAAVRESYPGVFD